MFTTPVNRLDDLQRLRPEIDRLAGGAPTRGAAWLTSWWESFGGEAPGGDRRLELASLAVYDPSRHARMVGFVPLCRHVSRQQGAVLRWLGSGEVCSDYVAILSEPHDNEAVVDAAACWLLDAHARRWDVIELEGIRQDDRGSQRLLHQLREAGHQVYFRPEAASWRIALPDDWEAFLARLSKSHRKQVRRAVRDHFDSGECRLHVAETEQDLADGFAIFRELHVNRRRELGQAGCFASPRFAQFLELAAGAMFAAGRLKLTWLEYRGEPIAADFNLFDGDALYAYQGGFDPSRHELRPGWLLTLATLRMAIEQRWRTYDFLRGDEPYKAHWRAEAHPMTHYRVVSRQASRRLRHGLWRAGERAKALAVGEYVASWQPWEKAPVDCAPEHASH
ncbi:MAG: GNAT family N-acetyltransferase [Pirellulales bacterium]